MTSIAFHQFVYKVNFDVIPAEAGIQEEINVSLAGCRIKFGMTFVHFFRNDVPAPPRREAVCRNEAQDALSVVLIIIPFFSATHIDAATNSAPAHTPRNHPA